MASSSTTAVKPITFGPFPVTDQVFYQTSLSYALVNIKPIVPGHVLIIPFRNVARFTDLTVEETTDLFLTVQKVQRMLAEAYFVNPSDASSKPAPSNLLNGSFNIAIQDGVHSGQTVPHVHVHILPRSNEDKEGDGIYDRLQSEEGNVGGGLWDLEKRPSVEGSQISELAKVERPLRTVEAMNEEAEGYRVRMRALN